VSDGFRTWLAKRLLGTKFASMALGDDEIDAVAKRIGVDPDLLLEVRAEARIALRSRGLSPPQSNSKRASAAARDEQMQRLYQVKVWMPPVVHAAWLAECHRRGVHPPTFLRSLIHEYLRGTREPSAEAYWRWQGKLILKYHKIRIAEKAVIPHGAKRALGLRAAALGTTPIPVLRALVLEALAGEHHGIALVPSSMMFDDESRYNTGN
jgi:hypothetical protein